MVNYVFDLVQHAEQNGGNNDLGGILKARPFQLFYADVKEEVANYIASEGLRDAVNVSMATGRPLLLTGEPGTGKTTAATWMSGIFGLNAARFQVKSNSRAQDLLYTFDAVAYFRESQMAAASRTPAPSKGEFVQKGPLWQAIEDAADKPQLLLIDEIDKAPRDFPNDLLHELDRMEIFCAEQGKTVTLKDRALRPVIVITSNSERRLPEPFLRRCIYHNIVLDQKMLERIVDGRLKQTKAYFEAEATFRTAATKCFFALRDNDNLQKKPSVDEFWQWLAFVGSSNAAARAKVIEIAGGGRFSELPSLSALVKLSEDRAQLP
jgi:MoxR-like ATPase